VVAGRAAGREVDLRAVVCVARQAVLAVPVLAEVDLVVGARAEADQVAVEDLARSLAAQAVALAARVAAVPLAASVPVPTAVRRRGQVSFRAHQVGAGRPLPMLPAVASSLRPRRARPEGPAAAQVLAGIGAPAVLVAVMVPVTVPVLAVAAAAVPVGPPRELGLVLRIEVQAVVVPRDPSAIQKVGR